MGPMIRTSSCSASGGLFLDLKIEWRKMVMMLWFGNEGFWCFIGGAQLSDEIGKREKKGIMAWEISCIIL